MKEVTAVLSRYTRPEMSRIWSDEHKYNLWFEIELLVVEARAKLGQVPEDTAETIRRRASFDVEQIKAKEAEVKHDLIAFTTVVAETVGEPARHLHYGLTSSDVKDTALSLRLVQALDVIDRSLEQLLAELAALASRHKKTVMVGRTHGIHAEPTTLGLKIALWWDELKRQRERIEHAREQIGVGKISGAVGTYAHLEPVVEAYVCENLGLKPTRISSQVLQRDRHAAVVFSLASLATTLDKIATEIRGLQKTEVREVEEPFSAGQKGSSAMPHKRNPIQSERISGLARVLRGHVVPALENMVLWHERDISHSSVERVVLPDATSLVDYSLRRLTAVLEGLVVHPETMEKDLAITQGLIYSEAVLLALVDAGMGREDAYEVVQRAAARTWEGSLDFRESLKQEPVLTRYLSDERLEACFKRERWLRYVDMIFERLGLE